MLRNDRQDQSLVDALERAAAAQPFIPNYERAIIRANQMRARRTGTVAALTATTLAAVTAGLFLVLGHDPTHSTVTATPTPQTEPAAGSVHAEPSSEADIRKAFTNAFTGGTPEGTMLGAIENGSTLLPVLAELRRQRPDQVETTHISIGSVTFGKTDFASVDYAISYVLQGSSSWISGAMSAVKIDGQWKVTQSGYCAFIQRTGVNCPQ